MLFGICKNHIPGSPATKAQQIHQQQGANHSPTSSYLWLPPSAQVSIIKAIQAQNIQRTQQTKQNNFLVFVINASKLISGHTIILLAFSVLSWILLQFNVQNTDV